MLSGKRGAHHIRRAEHVAESWVTLHTEYQTIAALAQAERWDDLLERSGLNSTEQELVRLSPALGALHAALRDAEAWDLDVETTLPLLVRGGTLDDAEDVAAVLYGRVSRWTLAAARRRQDPPDMIAGLIPRARGVTDPDMARALIERERAMERRAVGLATEAMTAGQMWTRQLGTPPTDPVGLAKWAASVATIAGYRERWSVTSDPRPLGADRIQSIEQLGHRRRAQAAVEQALALSCQEHRRPNIESVEVGSGVEQTGPEL